MARIITFALILLALLAPSPGLAQTHASKPVLYSASTGAVRNVPLIPGWKYTMKVENVNPLCYSYTADVAIKERSADLSKIIASFGSLSALTGSGTPPAVIPPPPSAPPSSTPPPSAMVVDPQASRSALDEAENAAHRATILLSRLRGSVDAVDPLVKAVNSPTCSRNTSFDAIQASWDAARSDRNEVARGNNVVADARTLLLEAESHLRRARAGRTKTALATRVSAASTEADRLATKLSTLLPELFTAGGEIAAAAATGDFFETEVVLPAGTESAEITLRATERKPAAGKTAATWEQKSSLPVRRGMRVFLSAGFLASTARSHDYERTNRPCPASADFACDTIYSTYANRGPGRRGFAFSPVLQVNVAFRDVLGAGASFHTSAGVAARSVNGTISPEFILGAGTGLLDQFLVTAGLHIARDERLLLGPPNEVESRPVSDKITPTDAVALTWRPAFVLTTTLRLN